MLFFRSFFTHRFFFVQDTYGERIRIKIVISVVFPVDGDDDWNKCGGLGLDAEVHETIVEEHVVATNFLGKVLKLYTDI